MTVKMGSLSETLGLSAAHDLIVLTVFGGRTLEERDDWALHGSSTREN